MKEVSANPAAAVRQAYAARFGGEPQFLIRAPGRVNLIGEHTDSNVGFVLPMAIDRAVWLALRPMTDGQARVHDVDVDEMGEFSLSTLLDSGPPEADTAAQGWLEYLKCTAWALLDAGHRLTGWEGAVAGDVPIGAGLSSSPSPVAPVMPCCWTAVRSKAGTCRCLWGRRWSYSTRGRAAAWWTPPTMSVAASARRSPPCLACPPCAMSHPSIWQHERGNSMTLPARARVT